MNEQEQNIFANVISDMLSSIRDVALYDARKRDQRPGTLGSHGLRVFSQSDEDGITMEIIRRLNIKDGVFIEFGVGNGLENNTLVLAAQGWTGFWVDVEQPAFNLTQVEKPRFGFMQRQVTLGNVMDSIAEGLRYTNNPKPDLISMDFEGNDYWLVKQMLEGGIDPSIWIVEYNGKFVPPIEWVMPYDPDARWNYDDYFGASLQSYANLFAEHGYFLACCNGFTGANAFFIKAEHRESFPEVSDDVRDAWVEPRYYLPRLHGHATSPRTVSNILNRLNGV